MPPISRVNLLKAAENAWSRNRHSWLALLLTGMLIAEMLVRCLGLIDFPVYEANSMIGYIPAAGQHGSFLNKNKWEFNSLHMGASEFTPSSALDVLLVGDSVVFGGNGYRQQDRLGPVLQDNLQASLPGVAVWPISAGSWALRNELAWLRQNPQVPAQVDRVLFVVNTGDFGEASSWSCEATHPRTKPTVALWYLFNKYVYAFEACSHVPAGLQVPPGNLATELKSFLLLYSDKTAFVLYPDRAETENPALAQARFAAGLALLTASGARSIVQLAGNEHWRIEFYKDEIHPSSEGDRVLGSILAKVVESTLEPAGNLALINPVSSLIKATKNH